MSSPLCLNQIMRFLSNSDTLLSAAGSHTHLEGGVLVAAMFLASVWHSLALQHYIALCFASGAHAKALVQHRVFLSVLSLPTSTIQDLSTGQLTNLMAKDAGKVQDFMLFVHNIWSAPLSACWWLY
jgi:ABC-type multidrug transport system fused ATPase/permease subunit